MKRSTEVRVEQLKLMHKLMTMANDENLYMTWITGWIPDEPQEEDFVSVAEDDKEYDETLQMFSQLIAKKGYRW